MEYPHTSANIINFKNYFIKNSNFVALLFGDHKNKLYICSMITNYLKILYDIAMNEDGYVRCTCQCHSDPNMIHIMPCCDNGWIKIGHNDESEDND